MPAQDRLIRTSIYLQADMIVRVKVVAARRGVTLAQIVRDSLEKTLGDHRPAPKGGFLR